MLDEKELKEFVDNFDKDEFNEKLNHTIDCTYFTDDTKFHVVLNIDGICTSTMDIYEEDHKVTTVDILHNSTYLYIDEINEDKCTRTYMTNKLILKGLYQKLEEVGLSTDYLSSVIGDELVYFYYHGKLIRYVGSINNNENIKDLLVNTMIKKITEINQLYIKFIKFKNKLIESELYRSVMYIDFINDSIKINDMITSIESYDDEDFDKINRIIEYKNYLDINCN